MIGGHLLLAWLQGTSTQARTEPVDVLVYGVVKDRFNDVPMSGVRVRLIAGGQEQANAQTRMDGYYQFTLDDRLEYEVRYEAEGMATKWCEIDLRDLPVADTAFYGMVVNMRMHPPLSGMPRQLQDLPMGRAAWSAADGDIVWDQEHTASVQVVLDSLVDRHLTAHPELGPDKWSRAQVKGWELLTEHGVLASALVVLAWWLVVVMLGHVLGYGRLRWALSITFLLCIPLVWMLRDAAGPLRFVALMAFMVGVFSFLMGPLMHLVHLLGRARSSDGDGSRAEDGYFME